jgi:hypothetical protein
VLRQRRQDTSRWLRRLLALAGTAALLAAVPAGGALAQPRPDRADTLQISVLSGRADVISGGDALVEVSGFGAAGAAGVEVRLNGLDVTAAFAVRADGRFVGLVTGLRDGRNLLTATVERDRGPAGETVGAGIVITNHPIGGPVFAGPQVQPWDCTMHSDVSGLGPPTDAQCDTATMFRFVYMPTSHAGFRPYDPASPPADVATTTTDQGVAVPYVVRVETGVEDRGIYQVAVLSDPALGWAPWASQPGWNHKVLWPFGGGSAPEHVTGLPVSVLDDTSLSRGFLVASSGLNVHGQDANENVSAEAVTMLKEHVVETYGEIRYTIGAGCSGGSIQQYSIAEEYPGLLDGILPNCSYPDLWTTSTEVQDCGLLVRYFATATGWTDAQKAAVEGTRDTSVCNFWNATFVPVGLPSRAQNCGFAAGDPRVYQPVTNPDGVRCDVADYQEAIWGPRPRRVWTAPEQEIGHGFGASPADNVGVQYGLDALRAGVISREQFVDLNAKLGGFDVDAVWQPARSAADPGTMPTAYRAGQVTEALRLDDVPIIDLRGSANVNDIHSDYHSWEMRARLDEANGGHANQVIWTWRSFGSFVGIVPPPDIAMMAFLTMDSWLAGIEADHGQSPLAAKVLAHRPAAAVDACWPASTLAAGGAETVDPGYVGACGQAFPHFADARQSAGQRVSGTALKCVLAPLHRKDVPGVTDEEWSALRAAFPHGVCDWTRPAVGYQPSLPWMSFADGPGGQPLGPAPSSFPIHG